MDLTDLYRGPLEDFVARRTQLVREIRQGDASAAQAIGKLRKPPVSIWAIDQLPLERQHVLAELLAAAADASDAQRAVAGGQEPREILLTASGRLRDAVEAAASAAEDVLERAGHARGEDIGRRIRGSLQAAATGSAAERLALWRGTLDHEVVSSGFGALEELDDDAELAALLAPLRRHGGQRPARPQLVRTPSDESRVHRVAAERALEHQETAAERARSLAASKRQHADALAEALRIAETDATHAEEAADAAEEALKSSRAALEDG